MTTITEHAGARPLALPFRLTPTRAVLWAIFLVGLGVAAWRYFFGIGAISNLNDVYSFGLWISFDLFCGVPLAAGGFTTATAVYILGNEDFRPVIRPATLTAFLGYAAVAVALLVDLGRPERIWHMMIYWNPESPLFEIGLCVMTYLTVLALECMPVAFEGLKLEKPARFFKKISVVLVVMGTLLSTAHQSTLGTFTLLFPDKLPKLWYSPLTPLMFFASACAVGLAMVIFEGTIAAHGYKQEPETHMLGRLSKAIPVLLGIYLALKAGDLAYSGDYKLLFSADAMAPRYWLEIIWSAVLPIILFSIPKVRNNQKLLFASALIQITGLMFNRFNMSLLTWTRPAGAAYFPAWGEFAISAGVIALTVIVYDLVARNWPLFGEEPHRKGAAH
jgi:Ni/Fe-hydrogenase subunit HybB-like protein